MCWRLRALVSQRLGFGRSSEFGRKHPGMGEEPGVDRALGQRLLHVRPCLFEPTRGSERPCQRIVRKNVCAGPEFALRELDSEFCLLPSGRQEQRKRPRIVLRAVAALGPASTLAASSTRPAAWSVSARAH